VLAPRLDPALVRAGAERLADWPALAAETRAILRTIETDLHALDPRMEAWEAQGAQAAEGFAAAEATLAAARERAATLATGVLGALEAEIAPDVDRAWTLHVEGTKLLGAFYEQSRSAAQSSAVREGERAASRAAVAARELRRQEAALGEIERELTPLPDRWAELGAAHAHAGADLRRAWQAARRSTERTTAVEEPFAAPRPLSAAQAAGIVPALAQEAGRQAAQIDELERECAREERDLPADLPWPAWPAAVTDRLDVEDAVGQLTALLRRVRNEPVRARERLDRLNTLRDRTRYNLERALGAADALADALAADPDAAGGRTVSLKSQADSVVSMLQKGLRDLARLARRLEAATVAYDDVTDGLAAALKGGRTAATWEQGRRLQADYTRLKTEYATTATAAATARESLVQAQNEVAAIQAGAAQIQDQSVAAEQGLLAHSQTQTQAEEAALRRHIATLRAKHEAVLAALTDHAARLHDLAAFADGCADLKIRAADVLCDRAHLLAALAEGRLADTAEARTRALWPLAAWPAGDMRYLLPVWALRYRVLGRRAPRLLVVTPGTLRLGTPGARLRPAPGFALTPLPGLVARLAADGLADPTRPGPATPLPGPNLLTERSTLLARWRAFAVPGLVAPWIGRLL
jgi:hypothetical protein